MAKIHLGATVFKNFVDFAFWLPNAEKVDLILDDKDFSAQIFPLQKTENDVWYARVKEAEIGMTYQFRAEFANPEFAENAQNSHENSSNSANLNQNSAQNNSQNNSQNSNQNAQNQTQISPTISKIFNDPRARQLSSSADGKSVIADGEFDWGNDENFAPETPEKQIIYELHVGTFNQPDESTLGNFATAAEKFDYLKNLGVNMIEILPPTSMLDGAGWGYAPINLFAVEENYGGPRGLREFIKSAHENGFGVIIDIVYNHFHPDANLPDAYYFAGDLRNTPWGPRLDYTKTEVQNFLEDNVALWLNDFHADGLRLDFTLGIRQKDMSFDDSAHEIPGGWQILQKITHVAHKIKPRARIIAEDNGANNYLTLSAKNGGAGFDSQWDVEMPRVLDYAFGTNGNSQRLTDFVRDLQKYYNGDFRGKICFAESHDTAALANGNRRIARDFNPENPFAADAAAMTILAGAMAFSVPGIPMIFMGQEMLARDGWSAQDALNWENAEKFSGVILAHQHLINLRKNLFGDSAGLLSNEFYVISADENAKILVFQRGMDLGNSQNSQNSANNFENSAQNSSVILSEAEKSQNENSDFLRDNSNNSPNNFAQNLQNQPVLVIANFNREKVENYQIPQLSGAWKVRFNSSWKGYSREFSEVKIDKIDAETKFSLPPFCVLVLTKN